MDAELEDHLIDWTESGSRNLDRQRTAAAQEAQ
jgi:hypothetical protein